MPRLSWDASELDGLTSDSWLDRATQQIEDTLAPYKPQPTPVPTPEPTPAPPAAPISFNLADWTPWQTPTDAKGRQPTPTAANPAPSFNLADWTPWSQPAPADTSATSAPSGGATARPVASSGTPVAMPSGGQADAAPAPTAAMPTGASGDIDNSSREAFVRTAYPQALQAAGGDPELAKRFLAMAISENGTVGNGGAIGVGFNFGGIKYDPQASGSGNYGTWESEGGNRVNQNASFAAYANPQAGFNAIPRFLQTNFPKQWAQYQQTHDAAGLIRAINAGGYATDPDWHRAIESIVDGSVTPNAAPSQTPQQASGAAGEDQFSAGSYTPNQIEAATGEGLDYETALAVCGPAAAIAFARRSGRNPTMAEAVGLAKQVGWTAAAGMAGPASQQRLLSSMGVAARLVDGAPDWGAVVADVQRGNPVILSTPGHYFVAERYAPASGAFDFGNSAAVLKASGGRRWFRPDELPSLGMGEARASLFMDSPESPSPSVVAGRTTPNAAPSGAAVPSLEAGASGPPAAGPSSPSWSPDSQGTAPAGAYSAPAGRAGGGGVQMQINQPTQGDTTTGEYDPRDADQGPHEGGRTGWNGYGDSSTSGLNNATAPTGIWSTDGTTPGGSTSVSSPVSALPVDTTVPPINSQTDASSPTARPPATITGLRSSPDGSIAVPPDWRPPAEPEARYAGTVDTAPPLAQDDPGQAPFTRSADPTVAAVRATNPGAAPEPRPAFSQAQRDAGISQQRANDQAMQVAPRREALNRANEYTANRGSQIHAHAGQLIDSLVAEANQAIADAPDDATAQQVREQYVRAIDAVRSQAATDYAQAAQDEMRRRDEMASSANLGDRPPAAEPIDPLKEGAMAGALAVGDRAMQSAPPAVRAVQIVTQVMSAMGGAAARRVAEALNVPDYEVARILGHPYGAHDVIEAGGAIAADPSNYLMGPLDPIVALGRGAERVGEAVTRAGEAGARAAGRGARALGEGLAENASRAPGEMQLGSGVVPADDARRFYHGTAGEFGRPDPETFDPNGMFGPGYYLTNDARVANSYADTRGAVERISGDDARGVLQRAADAVRQSGSSDAEMLAAALEAKIKGLPTWADLPQVAVRRVASDAGLESRVSMADHALWEPVRQAVDDAYQPRGSNVRAVDVPSGLRLFDAEVPLRQTPTLLDDIEQALGEPDRVARFRNAMRDQSTRSRALTGQSVYDALDQTMGTLGYDLPRPSPSPSSARGPRLTGKEGANEVLSRAGYDGVRYDGGKIMGIKGEDGNTIFHEAVAIFPGSLDKITNAFSGEVGGSGAVVAPGSGLRSTAYNAAQGAVLGAGSEELQAEQEGRPVDRGEQLRRAVTGGTFAALAGNRSVRGALARGAREVGSGVVTAGRETETAPPFYSALRRAVDEKMPNRASPNQVAALVRNAGVKPDELTWTGFEDWLRQQKGAVTKQQALDFLDQNAVKVEEVVKGGPSRSIEAIDREMDALHEQGDITTDPALGRRYDELMQERTDVQHGTTGASPTKYGNYTLPGGENYRELLLTLPEKPAAPSQALATAQQNLERLKESTQAIQKEEFTYRNRPTTGNQALDTERYNRWRELDGQRRLAENELIRAREAVKAAERAEPDPSYRGPHWDEPNTLAHVRFSERTAPDGARVLNIEEVQSDWHQAGRKQGYNTPPTAQLPDGFTMRRASAQDAEDWANEMNVPQGTVKPGDWIAESGMEFHPITAPGHLDEAAAVRQMAAESDAMGGIGQDFTQQSGVPDAPFKKTWPELAIKRMIRWAAENDFDRITWPPGSVHAERYSLERHIDDLKWERDPAHWSKPEPTWTLTAKRPGGGLAFSENNVSAGRMGDLVGQELAQRITSAEGETGRLTGLDLRTGGEGMRGFYDQILPQTAQKLGKKFGARVGTSEIPVGTANTTANYVARQTTDGWQIHAAHNDVTLPQRFPTQAAADARAAQMNASLGAVPTQTVHSMDITPAMKASVMQEGQPLFAGVPFDPTSAIAGGAAGAATGDDEGDGQPDPLRTLGGAAVAGALNLRRFPGVQKAVQASQKRAAAMAARNIQPLGPLAWTAKLAESVGYSSMIGVRTATVNLLGNAMEPLWSLPKEPVRGISRAITERNPSALREPAEMLAGAWHGFQGAGREMIDALMARGRYVSPDQPTLSQQTINPIAHAIATVPEIGGRVFSGLPDALFGSIARGAGEAREAAQVATNNGLRGSAWKQHVADLLADVEQVKAGQQPAMADTQRVIDAGTSYAKEQTFQTEVGKVGKGVEKVVRLGNAPVIGKLVTPFFNTPWNMTVRAAERTPLLGNVVGLTQRTRPAFDKNYDVLAGTALIAGLVAGPAAAGHITGSGPDDAGQRALMRENGWLPQSTLVRGTDGQDYYIQNNKFGIYGKLLNVIGEAHDAMAYGKKDASVEEQITGAARRFGNLFENESQLQGLSDLLGAITDPGKNAIGYAGDLATRLTPYAATARDISTSRDTQEREVDRGKNVPASTKILQKWQLGTGQRSALPVNEGLRGPQENTSPGIWAFFPKASKAKNDPVVQVFLNANVDIPRERTAVTVENKIPQAQRPPGQPSSYQIPLTPAQTRMWENARNRELVRLTEAAFKNPLWDQMAPGAQQDLLQKYVQASAKTADTSILTRPDMQTVTSAAIRDQQTKAGQEYRTGTR